MCTPLPMEEAWNAFRLKFREALVNMAPPML